MVNVNLCILRCYTSFFFVFFFFFKQKTAYEMRISDWSSDVCSSDLMRAGGLDGALRAGVTDQRRLDGIRRPLPRGTIIKNHIDLVHVDMVATEPVAGPVLVGDRRCTREY